LHNSREFFCKENGLTLLYLSTKNFLRSGLIIFSFTLSILSSAQTIGGGAAYNFLQLPSSPLLTATGGVNVSYQANEVGLAANNPALLNQQLHGQLNISFNNFLGDIRTYSTTGAYHSEKLNATFGGHIYFVDYGSIPQTDAAGNVSGSFHPIDFVVQAEVAKKYLDKWSYGLTLKFINSSYQQYTSNALAFDVGILYADSANDFSASVLAKNMGFQLKTYAGEKEDLPFDLQVGITKKLAKAPFAFSATAQHVHQFNTVYNDAVFNTDNSLQTDNSFFNKLINHFVVASHIFIGNNLEATLGYNHLRRTELNLGAGGNGLNGFSVGLRIKFQKLQVLYARSNYQRNIAFNQIGITVGLNKIFGLGEL
jgi:hypothetical protein